MADIRKVRLTVFEREDMQRVHDRAIELLARNGVAFYSERACEIFKNRGFKVEGQQIYFTEDQVQAALETCPPDFVLKGRNPNRDLRIGGGDYGVPSPIGPVNVISLDEPKHSGTLKDVERLVKIYQASDVINVNTNNGVEANDVDMNMRHFEIMRVLLRNTDKPFYTRCFDYDQVHQALDMVEIAVGDKLVPGGNTYLSSGSCPALSPLAWSDEVADFIIALSERGQACSFGNATTAGVTGPITPMSMTVLQTAEQLSGIVLSQLVHPGTPVLFGTGAVPANMRRATYCCGAPGRVTLALAMLEMGKRFYHLPSRSEGYATDSTSVDAQCLMESYEQLMANILGGGDYMLGEIGTIEGLMTTSLEKTILDEELTSRLLYIRDGFDVSDEAALVEEICEEGSGGTFLMSPSTLEEYQNIWYPRYTDWDAPMAERGYTDFDYVVKRANAEWKRRLEEAPETLLDSETERDLDRYIELHE